MCVSNFSSSQNVAQGHVKLGIMHKLRPMHGWSKKIVGPIDIPLLDYGPVDWSYRITPTASLHSKTPLMSVLIWHKAIW